MEVLDSPDFDPIAYINQKFPTEASLDGLDAFTSSVDAQIHNLDEELSKAIQTQSVAGKQATQVYHYICSSVCFHLIVIYYYIW